MNNTIMDNRTPPSVTTIQKKIDSILDIIDRGVLPPSKKVATQTPEEVAKNLRGLRILVSEFKIMILRHLKDNPNLDNFLFSFKKLSFMNNQALEVLIHNLFQKDEKSLINSNDKNIVAQSAIIPGLFVFAKKDYDGVVTELYLAGSKSMSNLFKEAM